MQPVVEEKKVVKLTDFISQNFYDLFDPNANLPSYRIFKGGRSSLKSTTISIKLVLDFLSDPKANAVIFRKVAKYLSTSVYEQIMWAINLLGVSHEFKPLKSPLKIIHKSTQTAFYFFGVDEPQKIKSAKISVGYVKDLWFEETAEFNSVEELDQVTDTFVREELPADKEVNIYHSYNPPRNPYSWVNEWLEEIKFDPDYYIHHSTYEEDTLGVLSGQFLRKVLKIKENDPDYHDWMYLGKVIGLGDVIYNIGNFNLVDQVKDNDRLIYSDLVVDGGYSTSATTFIFIGIATSGNVYVLDTYYYSPKDKVNKKAPSDFSKDLWNFTQNNIKKWNLHIDTWVIDSAEAALRNQFKKDYGVLLTPSKKKAKEMMIDNVRDLAAQNRVHILDNDNNKSFYDEHKKYQWDTKSLEPGKEPKPIKEEDHTVDAFQYFVNNNLRKLMLK